MILEAGSRCQRLAVFSLGPHITWVLCFNESELQGERDSIYSVGQSADIKHALKMKVLAGTAS